WHLPAPDEATAELVEVSSLGEYDISIPKCITLDLGRADGDLFHLRQVEKTVLYIGNAQIRTYDPRSIAKSSADSYPRLHESALFKGKDFPVLGKRAESCLLRSNPARLCAMSQQMLHQRGLAFSL